MRLDKKNDARGLRLVLWEGMGRARAIPGIAEDAVRSVLD